MQVVARCRPLTEEERSSGAKTVVKHSHEKISLEGGGKVGVSYHLTECYSSILNIILLTLFTCNRSAFLR